MLSLGSFAVPLLAVVLAGQASVAEPVTGTVRDASGQAVSGAVVIVRTASGAEQQSISAADGRFSVTVASPAGSALTVVVRASGFSEARQTITAGATAANVQFVLQP